MATSTFRMGLPKESTLRDFLIMWPPEDMHQLIRRIEEHNRLEDDQLQGKGKAPTSSQYRKEYCPEKFQLRTRRELKALGEGSE